jgi:hypothetical protein
MAKGERAPYRALTIPERDMLYAYYEKWNGNMAQMVLDKDILFKSYTQLRYYASFYHFHERIVENRRKKAEEVMKGLQDAKVLAIQQAMRILEAHNVFVFNKTGVQIFDAEGNPLIVERLPYYKEIKAAWEIIKTELGEPTTIGKTDITSKGEAITSISVNVVHGTGPASNGGIRPELSSQEANSSQPGRDGQQ